jgi:hypothetical protein
MLIVHLLILLGSTLCVRSQASFHDSPHQRNSDVCPQLVGRREWRAMEREDQASWIAGVKVRIVESSDKAAIMTISIPVPRICASSTPLGDHSRRNDRRNSFSV